MNPRLGIAFLASEVTPFAKTGGLGDVAAALPKSLGELGHDVRIFTPLYGSPESLPEPCEPMAAIGTIELTLSGQPPLGFDLYRSSIPGSQVPVHLIHCPVLYGRDRIYTNDPDEPLRFVFFCRAVLESCQRLGFAPDVFHCNDWQTALTPLFLKTLYAWDELFSKSRTLLSVHNLGYQGVFSSELFETLGIRQRSLFDAQDLEAGRINFLKEGVKVADALSTVSPTYAREIQTPEYGFGLDGLLRDRGRDLVGILNGIDEDLWNPVTDSAIPFRYSSKSLWRKKKNKAALVEKLGLDSGNELPLVGMVSRLSPQKGIELLFETLPELLSGNAFQLVALGSGEPRYQEFFSALKRRFPSRVCFHSGFHNDLAHWIEAAADIFLMPSRYEPCGLNQMYSLKYGTVPVVRKTGGLADSVEQFDPESGEGTGFVFEHFTPEGVAWALTTAVRFFGSPATWKRIQSNGMSRDFSWKLSAERYLELYQALGSH